MRRSRDRVVRLLVVAPALWVACDTGAESPSAQRPADGSAGGVTGTTSETCAAAELDRAATPSAPSVEELLVDDWLSCGGSVFGTDEAGLAFTADGAWFKLFVDGQGALVRADETGDFGTWKTLDTSDVNGPGSQQLDLEDGQGNVVRSVPVFATEPAKVRLDDIGARRTDYARLAPYPTQPAPAHPATSAALPLPDERELSELASSCERAADVEPEGPPDPMQDSMTGVWVACAQSVFATEEAGIELNDDGRFYKLYVADDGGLERGAGFDETGVWRVADSHLGAAPRPYLELSVFGSGKLSTQPRVLADPRGLELGIHGVPRARYVAAAR